MANPFANIDIEEVNPFSGVEVSDVNPFAGVEIEDTDLLGGGGGGFGGSSVGRPNKPTSTFFKILDFIQRPNFAVMTGIHNLVDKDEKTTFIEGLKRGITGKSKITGVDVLDELGFKPETKTGKVSRFAAGLAGDVLLDPITYIPFGALAKTGVVKKAISGASKTIRKTPGFDTFAGLFNIRPSDIKTTDFSLLKHAKARGRGKLTESFIKANNMIRELGLDIDKLAPEHRALISKVAPAVERLRESNLESFLQPLAGKIAALSEEMTGRFVTAGGKTLDDPLYRHLMHVPRDLKTGKKYQYGSKAFSTKTGIDQSRDYMKVINPYTGEEIVGNAEKIAKAKGLKLSRTKDEFLDAIDDGGRRWEIRRADIDEIANADPRFGNFDFDTDPVKILANMEKNIGRKEAGKEFLETVRPLGVARKTATHTEMGHDILTGLWFEPGVAKHIDETFKTFSGDEATNQLVRLFDKTQNIWKYLATAVNPAFHSRNFISNLWQNRLAGMGVETASEYAKAHADILRFQRTGISKPLREFIDNGLMRSGAFFGEIPETIDDLIRKPRHGLKGIARSFLDYGRTIGNHVEDSAKLAHFRWARKKGMTSRQAAESVRMHLFDYEDLSNFERARLKRILPFYTWTRKNIPLQLQKLVEKPGLFAVPGKARNALEKETFPADFKHISPKMLEKSLVQIPGGRPGKPAFITAEGFIPSADIGKLARPTDTFLEMLTPFVKTPLEMGLNRNFYFDQPLERFPGERSDFLRRTFGENFLGIPGARTPFESQRFAEPVLRAIRPLNEVARFRRELQEGAGLASLVSGTGLGAKVRTHDERRARQFARKDIGKEISGVRSRLRKAKDAKERERLRKILINLQRQQRG